MIFAIRRYTSTANRPFAFSIFYVTMNCSAFVAQLLVNLMRHNRGYTPDGVTLWRLMIWLSCGFGISTFILSFLFRDPPAVEETLVQRNAWQQVQEHTRTTLSEAKFWRLAALCVVFVGVRL